MANTLSGTFGHVNAIRLLEIDMPELALVVLVSVLVVIVALLTAAGAGKLARLDGATYPAAITRAAAAFGVVLTVAAAVTGALATCLT
jgi:hypothetical protein